MSVTPRCFSAEVFRRGLRTFITSCDLDEDSFSTVCHHVPVHHFLSVVLQCHVVRCHSIDVCINHHWKLRCKPRWADMTKTSRIDHQLVLLSFPLLSQIFDFPAKMPSSAFTLRFVRLLVPTIRCLVSRVLSCLYSFDILHRIVSVLLSFLRNDCLSGFLFLSCHPSCPCRILLCLSHFGKLHRLPLALRRVCFRLKSS